MKNKIEFPKNDTLQAKQISKETDRELFDQKIYSKTEHNYNLKTFKIIKGKVKIQGNNSGQKFAKNDWLGDEEELVTVWKRMLLFLKITFLFLLVFSLFILIQKNIL